METVQMRKMGTATSSYFAIISLALSLAWPASASVTAVTITKDLDFLVLANGRSNVIAYDFASGKESWRTELPSKNVIGLGVFPPLAKNFVVAVTHEARGPGLQLVLWGKSRLQSMVFYGVTNAEVATSASVFLNEGRQLVLADTWDENLYLLDVFTFTETNYEPTVSVPDLISTDLGAGYRVSRRNPYRHPSSLGIFIREDETGGDPWESLAGCPGALTVVGLTEKGYLYGWGHGRSEEVSSGLPRWGPAFVRDLKAANDSDKRHGVSCSLSGRIATTVSSREYGNLQIFDKSGMLVDSSTVERSDGEPASLRSVEWSLDSNHLVACSSDGYYVFTSSDENAPTQSDFLATREDQKCPQQAITPTIGSRFLLISGDGVWEYDASGRSAYRNFGSPAPFKGGKKTSPKTSQ